MQGVRSRSLQEMTQYSTAVVTSGVRYAKLRYCRIPSEAITYVSPARVTITECEAYTIEKGLWENLSIPLF